MPLPVMNGTRGFHSNGHKIYGRRSRKLEFGSGPREWYDHQVHTKDTDYKGYTRHASADEPQYEIKSDKTEHIAMHRGSALHKIS